MEENKNELKQLISNHYKFTQSNVAKEILENWEAASKQFIKVMPTEFKKALQKIEEEKKNNNKELKTA